MVSILFRASNSSKVLKQSTSTADAEGSHLPDSEASIARKRLFLKGLRFGLVLLLLCASGLLAWFGVSLFSKTNITLLLSSLGVFLLWGMGWVACFFYSLFIPPDLTTLPSYHPFKSAKKQEQYWNYYDTRSKQWPVESEVKYVETSYGKTLVRISGPHDAPILVLLPSANASSLIWIPNVKALSEHFRVYALDNIYDIGRSVYTRAFKTIDDMVHWLDELFTALQLGNQIHLMGLSFGGWLTSQYGLRFPHRLSKIVLVAPAATVLPFSKSWVWRALLSAMPGNYFMKKYMVNWAFQDLARKTDASSRNWLKTMLQDARMALSCFQFKMPLAPTVVDDSDWKRLRMPMLFLVGEHEVIYAGSAQDAVHRLNTIAPHATTEIIPNASHDLTIVQAALINQKVIAFLSQKEKSSSNVSELGLSKDQGESSGQ
jgi:pimeloyl-ACP methyl ester carboxylesterase